MNGPITEFTDKAQAYECLGEWQTRLFLSDWIIMLELLDEPIVVGSWEMDGKVNRIEETKTAEIKIVAKDTNPDGCVKFCAEEILVHELLHLRLDMFDMSGMSGRGDNPSIENIVYDIAQHQMVEQMARSFIMAKYNVGFDWFKNF